MPTTPAEIARRALTDHIAARSPAELLTQFAKTSDPEAFAGLVQQFGPLVLGVCRRILGPTAEVDDAFQTVFLALARRANCFRDTSALPAWLHRVALRTAHKALAQRASERIVTITASEPADPADPFANVSWGDVRRVLDEELDALPKKFRGPVVLCWLDGLTQDEAAAKLGTSLNTLKRRLGVGRELLRTRLTRRGLAPVLAATAVLVPNGLRADVPRSLAAAAIKTAKGTGPRTAGVSRIASFATTAIVAACGLAFVSAEHAPPEIAPPPHALLVPGSLLDGPNVPLPAGVTARFGGTRFRALGGIDCATLSPDGARLAVANGAGVQIYETATWRLLKTFPTDGAGGTWAYRDVLVFSPDGNQLAYTQNGRFAFVWDLKSDKLMHQFDGRDRWRWQAFCAFTPDGLLALSDKEKLRFFDPNTGDEKRSVTAPCTIALSPDAKHFVRHLNRTEPALVLGDAVTGTDLHTFSSDVGWWPRVSFTPDAKRLVLAPVNTTEIEVWDVAKRALVKRFRVPAAEPTATLTEHRGGLTPDGNEVWFQVPGGEIIRWDMNTFQERPRLTARNNLVTNGLFPLTDQRTILVPCSPGWVRVFDRHTGRERTVPNRYHDATTFALSPDDAFVAVGDSSGRLDLLDATTGEPVRTIREKGEPVLKLVFSPDSLALGIGEGDYQNEQTKHRAAVRAFEIPNGKEQWSRPWDSREKTAWSVWPLGFTTANRTVIARYPENASVWDTRTGKEHAKLAVKSFRAVTNSDGRWLAADEHGEILILDVATGKEKHRIEVDPEEREHKRRVGDALFAWATDNRTLATTLPEDHVCIINPLDGTVRARFDVHSENATDAIKSVLWRSRGHSIRALALSPDGKQLLAAALNGWFVALWDTRTGKRLAKLENGFQIDGVAFSSDGKSAFTFGGTGLGYRWDIEALITAQKPKK